MSVDADRQMDTAGLHGRLAAKGLLPAEPFADSGAVDAELLASRRQDHSLSLAGAVRGVSSWQTCTGQGFVSLNWAGVLLRSFDLARRLIAATATAADLTVTARLERGGNERGEAVSDAEIQRLLPTKPAISPQWNHTLSPRPEAEQMVK